VNIVGWKQNKNSGKKVRIQLRSGENIYCTKEHRWVLIDGKEVVTSSLKVGDKLKTCTLPDSGSHTPMILTVDILWLLGLYIAEGSHSEDTIQLALCSDELEWVNRIKSAIESVGGTVTYTLDGNKLYVRCYSKVFNAILSQYIGGRTSKDKHLKSLCWSLPNEYLKEIVKGYLDGDGCYEEKNKRWRLGFTDNSYLERDLRVLAGRLNAKLGLLRKGARIKSLNKTYPSIQGFWKWKDSGHYNEKCFSEIMSITEEKTKPNETMWDIEVDSEEHLFSLASGVITHNCKKNPMPEVRQPRYAQEFEYMFVFSKGKPKTFNPIMVPTKCGGQVYNSTCKNIDGESGRTKKNFVINSEKVHGNIFEIAVARNQGEKKHPAVFPEELADIHVKTWSNEGDLVLDPFMGSGTTAVSAIKNKRNYIGFDVNGEYCEMARDRIEQTVKMQR
jgi:site-specific DNA-methyltransferase (adenine-specific)